MLNSSFYNNLFAKIDSIIFDEGKDLSRLAVAFTGASNSGKTTLIVKVATLLIERGVKVAIIKNDPKDKAVFDIEGKDSDKFTKTGAKVVVTSPTRTTYFSNESSRLDDVVAMLGEFDILLVEGLKTLPLPRIAIFRKEIRSEYMEFSEALAVDESIDRATIAKEIDILDLNNPQEVIAWIYTNAKEV